MGENILIVHGGGPTSVINASLYGAVKEAKKYKEIEHIYAAKNGTGGLMREELIELENVPDEKLELLLNTPGSAIGTSRDQIEQAEYDRMIEVLLRILNTYFSMVATEVWIPAESFIRTVRQED